MVILSLRRRFSFVAAACIASGCGLRRGGDDTSAHTNNEGTIVPGAVVPSSIPEAAGIAGECSFSTPFPLAEGTGNVLGVWRDPTSHELFAASPGAPNEAVVRRVSLPDGALTTMRTLSAPSGAVVEKVWRAHGGDLLVAYRVGTTMHLGRDRGGGLVEETLARYYNPARDRSLGPVDDPSDSNATGLLSEPMYVAYASLCVNDTTTTTTLVFCSHYWPGNATVRRLPVAVGPVTSTTAMAQAHTYGGPTSTVVTTRGGSYAWEPLGRNPSGGTGAYGYGYARRSAITDTSRGGPMAAPLGSSAAVVWVNERGGAEVQAVSITGSANADPVPLPFVDVALEDVASHAGELLVALTTRADRAAHPATTTLVRLDPSINRDNPITVAPVRMPIANARITPVEGERVVFWSSSAGNATVATCRFLAP
jgi:hypothetical protein